jgi:hypothetical protein
MVVKSVRNKILGALDDAFLISILKEVETLKNDVL